MVYTKQHWASGPDGRTPLSADRLNAIEAGIAHAHGLAGGIALDSFPGSDDDKLTAALALQRSIPGMPPVVMSARRHTFNVTRRLYSGLKLVGARATGPQNLELAGSGYVATRVTLGDGIGSGEASWWVSPGSDVYDVYLADFAVSGDAGRSTHQFLDFPVSGGHTLYACEFRSLGFNFMRSVFGRKDRVCALTQVIFSGHWTVLNFWETAFTIGGSDNSLWMGGQVNLGNSASPKQTGSLSRGDYQFICSSLSKTNIGYIYLTACNGWRGLRIIGDSGFGLCFYGGVFEGYKAAAHPTSGAAPGTLIRIEGGAGMFFGPTIGQGMSAPHASERGLVHMTRGEWTFQGATFMRGTMAEATPCVFHEGGRLSVAGVTRPLHENWASRPRYAARAVSSGARDSFHCGDGSMLPV